MSKHVKISRGSWCMAFGLERPASLDQVIDVLGAFGYDGIELGGFFDHATVERYPDTASRKQLRSRIEAAGLEPAGLAYGPNGDLGRLPWSTDGADVLAAYKAFFAGYLKLAEEVGIPGMRIDPGALGPLPYGTDYDAVWNTVVETFREHAEQGAQVGVQMLWELESGQPFNHPSEVVKLVKDVDHPNFKMLYDTGHWHQVCSVGHNQVMPQELLPGGQIDLIKQLKGHIGFAHVCDTNGDVAQNMFGTKIAIGTGIIDFDELMPVLADAYDGEWYAVDTIPMSSQAWSDSYDDVAKLRALTDTYVLGKTPA